MVNFKKLINSRKKIIILVILLLIGGFAAWRILGKREDKTQYQTVQVERGMIISSVSASGQVLSVNIMSANTKASGIVKKVYVKDGDQVKKGDKILEIDLDFQGEQKNTQAWSSYLSAKNSLESTKVTLYSLDSAMWAANRKLINDAVARGLTVDDPTYIQQHDDWLAAEAKYINQKAAINQSQVALSNSWLSYKLTSPVITAPTDGVVTSLMYTEGMSIGSLDTGSAESNQKIATIQTEGLPVISVNLSEIDVSRVTLGKKATIILDSIADKTFTGEVKGVDRIGQTASGVTQYPAIIKLDSSSVEILPNMKVTTNIVLDRKDDVLLVPSSAVQSQNGQNYVQVILDDQPQSVLVTTGLTSDTQTEIISGVKEGDKVISGSVSSSSQQQNGGSPFGSSGMGGMMRIVH
ncbi:MAG TPA: efflux RND transporter periplasmic adaptor subunit [Candidatus Bathyarchaeia archaeon]|nr:efflux RND transporter periplasmic adaptor subunit [Candidatus Bathyarchaeia archaeon]